MKLAGFVEQVILYRMHYNTLLWNSAFLNNRGSNMTCVILSLVSNQNILDIQLFFRFKSNLVWSDALFHEESEYGLGFYFQPCVSEGNHQTLVLKILQKKQFLRSLFFYCLKYFESISMKTKAFRKFFLTRILRIKNSTNAENFVKFWDHFIYMPGIPRDVL